MSLPWSLSLSLAVHPSAVANRGHCPSLFYQSSLLTSRRRFLRTCVFYTLKRSRDIFHQFHVVPTSLIFQVPAMDLTFNTIWNEIYSLVVPFYPVCVCTSSSKVFRFFECSSIEFALFFSLSCSYRGILAIFIAPLSNSMVPSSGMYHGSLRLNGA